MKPTKAWAIVNKNKINCFANGFKLDIYTSRSNAREVCRQWCAGKDYHVVKVEIREVKNG